MILARYFNNFIFIFNWSCNNLDVRYKWDAVYIVQSQVIAGPFIFLIFILKNIIICELIYLHINVTKFSSYLHIITYQVHENSEQVNSVLTLNEK